MWRTKVGYAGGEKPSATYSEIGDHTECVEVEFDPTVVSYEELLDVFWKAHDPAAKPYSNQYASLVLASDDAQLAAARASAKRYEEATGRTVMTRIEKRGEFFAAEQYHQKYYLRNNRTLMREFQGSYPRDADIVASTAAARVNGYLGGYGSAENLEGDIGTLGLSDSGRAVLTDAVGDREGGLGCAIP